MESATQTLHRLTSYEAGRHWDDLPDDPRLVHDLETNDLARLPWFVKRYDGDLPRIDLPRDLPTTKADAVAVLAGAAEVPAAEPLDLAQLGRLLYLCAGVVRTTPRTWGTFYFRAAGSAGGRFPLEAYVAVPDGGLLPPGVHWYDAMAHALVQVGPAPAGETPTVVVTGVPWRTGWRYRERGYRHVYWDAGTMLSQLLAAASAAGLPAQLWSRFPDATVSALVGADGTHEWPVALVTLGPGGPVLEPAGPAAAGAVDAVPVEFPLATAAQRAGDRTELGPPWDAGAPVPVLREAGRPIDEVVLRRGSQRLMDPNGSLPANLFRMAMTAAMRGIPHPQVAAVHAVDGLAPGTYHWPDLDLPVRTGDLRRELYHLALDQDLASDAAFVVLSLADLAGADDRDYRDAHLSAGLVEGRLHLLAYAMGAGASGMTFLDYEIERLVGEPLAGVLLTCVGVPEYASAPGGPPGAPTSVRSVTPRWGPEPERR